MVIQRGSVRAGTSLAINASQSEDAEVTIAFDHADAHVYLRAGSTKTFQIVATTEYSITGDDLDRSDRRDRDLGARLQLTRWA